MSGGPGEVDPDPEKLLLSWVDHLDEVEWVRKETCLGCRHCKAPFKSGHSHHCRLCGHVFCSACTAKHHLPPRFEQKGKEGTSRVCYSCRDAALERRIAFEER